MYRLITGLIAYLSQKEEFNILILGLDNAGKTTFLERVKSVFTDKPLVNLQNIGPTIGQNEQSESRRVFYYTQSNTPTVAKITLSSSILQFWDLGGQRDLRTIWPKYYTECHAVCFLVDCADQSRVKESWTVFESVLRDPKIHDVPTLVLANKMDASEAITIEEIESMFKQLLVDKLNVSEAGIMPISALRGEGIRDAVNWLFVRVQNSRKYLASQNAYSPLERSD